MAVSRQKYKMESRTLKTFVSDASLVSAAGFSKHRSDIIRRQRHAEFLHRLLKFLLVYVTVAVFVKHLEVTHFRQKNKTPANNFSIFALIALVGFLCQFVLL